MLFDEPSPWPTGLAHINVLQIRAPYIARKPTESAQFYNFLKSHHILVAAVMQVLPSDTCGQGMEGIMSHKGIDWGTLRELFCRQIDLTPDDHGDLWAEYGVQPGALLHVVSNRGSGGRILDPATAVGLL